VRGDLLLRRAGNYDANSAFNPFVKLSYAIPLMLTGVSTHSAHVEWLGSSIAHSPIVSIRE